MKNNIKTIKEIILTTCCSFTVIIMLNVFLASEEYAMTIGVLQLKHTLIICIVTSIVVHFVLNLNFRNEWMYHVAALLSEFIAVFGVGSFLLKFIPFTPIVVFGVSIMLLFVHLFCIIMICYSQKMTADEINERLQLQESRKEDTHGKDN